MEKERTAASWVTWRDDRVTQAAVAWVLASVFIRFCEDNALVKPVWIAGAIGAALGDRLSYWFGFKYKEHVAQMWPLSRYPDLLPRGEAFVKNWGVPGIYM